ncbi:MULTISPECIES: TonB-dependent receptor [unclassified Acidovorax]|uniref:TonB-dependent receptor n=1 Tax=unclassified Acidovorax TaxID=2684926 RepID=UPI0028832FEF|nr:MULTISPECIES: TonB-dependent receptor [unclassified Acidovorax]
MSRPRPAGAARRPLHLLALAAALSAGFPGPAAWAAPVSIDLPTQPLGDALKALARSAGVTIAADSALIAGKTAPAVRGPLQPRDALQRLLAGSGLEAVESAPNAYLVRPAAPAAARDGMAATLATVTVASERIASTFVAPARQVTTLTRDEIALLPPGDGLGGVLARSVPGLSDSNRSISDYGQTLRGRNALVVVDGIALNTNRNSLRNMINIDPNGVDRVEVLRGSHAGLGSGASGGIIAVTTHQADGRSASETTVSTEASLAHPSRDGLGATVAHHEAGRTAQGLDYSVTVSGRRQGGRFDGHGDRIAPDASQGDLFDANTYHLGGKLAWRFDDAQRVQLSASVLRARQDTDYASDPRVNAAPLGTAVARPRQGLVLDRQNEVDNAMASIDYTHRNLAGSSVSAQVYARDNTIRFMPFDARAFPNRGGQVDQIGQDNLVAGARLTVDTPVAASGDTRLVWGADAVRERSRMPLDIFDAATYDASGGLVFRRTGQLVYMPWVTLNTTGLFGQLRHKVNAAWSVEGGLRYERSSASFDDFTPLSQLQAAAPQNVRGGTTRYNAWVGNLGSVWKLAPGQEVYGAFSQGFELPDVGLQVRNARPGFDIGASDLQPVKTNNLEAGWRGHMGPVAGTLAVFQSTSSLGGIQSYNNGLTLARTAERIRGIEATADHYWDGDRMAAGGSIAWMHGRERPQGATAYRPMTGFRVPPVKITAHVQYQPDARWMHRAQLTWFGSREYRLADGVTQSGRAQVRGYATVDVMTRFKATPSDTVTLGVQNLFNRYYLPLYSQLMASGQNNSRLPAAGATLTVSYQHRW